MNALSRAALLVPMVLAVALLASCADTPAPGPPPGQGVERLPTGAPPEPLPDRPSPAPDPLTSAPPPGGTALPADRVNASALPPGFPTLVWSTGGRTLGVYGRAGGCTEADARIASEDDARVVVAVSQVTTSSGPCTRELLYPALEVTLSETLGERQVVLRGEIR